MGRDYPNAKLVAEDCRRLSIADLKRWGYFNNRPIGVFTWKRPGRNDYTIGARINWHCGTEAMYLRLSYRETDPITGTQRDFDYTVDFTTTPCNYGYHRFWFVCPGCTRRVGVLYQRNSVFACRHCHNLSYASRNENSRFRGYPWRVIENDVKREKLEARVKHRYYAGQPAKLHQRILALS